MVAEVNLTFMLSPLSDLVWLLFTSLPPGCFILLPVMATARAVATITTTTVTMISSYTAASTTMTTAIAGVAAAAVVTATAIAKNQ